SDMRASVPGRTVRAPIAAAGSRCRLLPVRRPAPDPRPVPSLAMPRDRTFVTGTLAAVLAAVLFGMLGPLARFGAEDGIEGVAFVAWRALLGILFVGTVLIARGGVGESMGAIRSLSRRG